MSVIIIGTGDIICMILIFSRGKSFNAQCVDVDTSLTASVSQDQLNHQHLISLAYDQRIASAAHRIAKAVTD